MSANTTQTFSVKRSSNIVTGPNNYLFGELYAKYRKEQSFWGYDPSVLKSGIQKYARRAEVDKGLWCLMEMDLFSLLEWDGAALNAYLGEYTDETHCKHEESGSQIADEYG